MNAPALTGRPVHPPRAPRQAVQAAGADTVAPATAAPRALGRNALVTAVVVALHAGLILALHSALTLPTPPVVVPAQVLAEFIAPPAPQVQPAPPKPPVPPSKPAKPSVQQKAAPQTPARPQARPLAIADPTPSPNAPAGSAEPSPPAPPAPAPVAAAAPVAPPAPPAPPAVQLPSSSADYLQNPKPPYPPLSKRLGEQGKVIVRVLIAADGQPRQAELRQSSGFERLDQAALATVMKWRYVPGKRGSVPEEMWFNVPINFVLE